MSIVPRNFTNHFWHIRSVTAPSSETAQVFLCVFQLHFYLSWNNKAWYTENIVSPSIFNIKMAQNFSNFDFLNAGWYDSCHNAI